MAAAVKFRFSEDDEPDDTSDRKNFREGDRDAWGERDEELCNDEDIRNQVLDVMKTVSKAFESQWERANDTMDWWDCYNCELSGHQVYQGNSQIYVPIIQTAVNARRTRFVNQIFPRSGRNVDVITSEEKPWDLMALLETYIRKTRLRTQVIPAMLKNGDVEGQYNLYVTWADVTRYVAYKQAPTIELDGEEIEDPDADSEDYDVVEDEVSHQQPIVEVLADSDVVVFPPTAASIEHALAQGGGVAIIRRWTKEKVQQMIDDGEIDEEAGEALIEQLRTKTDDPNAPDIEKKHADAAGIQIQEGMKILVGYEVWSHLKRGDERRLCRVYYGGGQKDTILSCKRNPYWCDKVPLLSAAEDKISNVFKGLSKVKFCADLQYAANDAVNEGWDSAQYALMPIVMTDPAKNPRVGSMVLNLAAIWQTNPNDTKFASFPPLWKDAFALVASMKQEIFQVLSVTPAMIAQSTGQKQKRNQAEIAAEQQAELLQTADAVIGIQDEILTPLLRWFVDLDHQFRDKSTTVVQYGELGLKLSMIEVTPIQSSRRFEFRWWGVEQAQSAQMLQQQIASINVVKGIPPDMLPGHKMNLVPFVQLLLENAFGSRLAPQIFQNVKDKLTIPAEMENTLLEAGFALHVHELDDDKAHMMEHQKAMMNGDPTGAVREHVFYHQMQMQQKMAMAQQAAMAMMRGGPQGGPPGGQKPPGRGGGGPRQGAQPGQARGGQNPPGAIHQDRLQGPDVAPRR